MTIIHVPYGSAPQSWCTGLQAHKSHQSHSMKRPALVLFGYKLILLQPLKILNQGLPASLS